MNPHNAITTRLNSLAGIKKPKGRNEFKNKTMESLYEKQCNGQYLVKYSKNGNLLRTAEQYPNGNWTVSEYPSSRTNMQGEYSNDDFNKIRRRLF